VTAVTEPKLLTIAEPGLSPRTRRRLIGFLSVYLVLYVATGIGGFRSHARQLQDKTESQYRQFEQRFQKAKEEARWVDGIPLDDPYRWYLHKNGPRSEVNWCVPVAPGLLVADSYSSVGPTVAKGGYKLVLYYGFGSAEFCLSCWKT
jgi:hypothetical protein